MFALVVTLSILLLIAGVFVIALGWGMPDAGFMFAVGLVIAFVGFVIWLLALTAHGAMARDLGQWSNTDPFISQWYKTLMQPDNPAVSCCGEADSYWADEVHYRDGKTYAVITDDRPDEPLKREHIDVGTEIEVPNHKLKFDQGNPTHHGVIFLSRNRYTYCYVMPGGV